MVFLKSGRAKGDQWVGTRDSEQPIRRHQVTDCISLLISQSTLKLKFLKQNDGIQHMIQFVVYK